MYTVWLKVCGYLPEAHVQCTCFLGRHHSDQDWVETCNKVTKMTRTFIKEITLYHLALLGNKHD